MLRKALIPVSFKESEDRFRAMLLFLKEAGVQRSLLLHVGAVKGRAAEAQKIRLNHYAALSREAGLEAEILLRAGTVTRVILAAAEEEAVDFLAINFKKKNFMARALLGSRVKDLIRLSTLPILVHKYPLFSPARQDNVFQVLYTVSRKGPAATILEYIKNNAFHADQVGFVHAGSRAPDPVVEKERQAVLESRFHSLAVQCGLQQEKTAFFSFIGDARRGILRAARRLPADLVVMGKSDVRRETSEPVLGSTAEEVSYKAPCSVMIIPVQEGDLPGKEQQGGSYEK